MKNKTIRLITLLTLIISPLLFGTTLHSQTAGTLTCSFTTAFTGGGYGTKYILAAWIETSSDTFTKTKLKYASGDYNHLATWTGKSGSNTTDATTGPTRPSPGNLSFIWNGTDVPASLVGDGPYKVWIEMSWAQNLTTGKTVQSFSFTKGSTADHQTPTSTTNFTGISIDWVPSNVGIVNNNKNEVLSIYPNPINSQSIIKYSLNEFSDVTISIYDISGKLISVLFDDNQAAGNYSLPLSLKAKAGIYFVKLYTGKTQQIQRILISE